MRSAPVLERENTPEFEIASEEAHAPSGLARRVGAFLLRELREMLPPTIFFFVGFNLIVLTTNLLLADYLVAFGNFVVATTAALVVGKSVLVANAMALLRRYDRAPLMRRLVLQRHPPAGRPLSTMEPYIGSFTQNLSASGSGCPNFPVAPALTIHNGVAQFAALDITYQGNVTPQGDVTMQSPAGQTLTGHIDP